MINPDLGLEADSILGFLGIGIFAFGIGARHFGLAATGAIVSGWFGGLALSRVGGLVSAIDSLESSVGASLSSSTSSGTNSAGSGTP